jgi:hypothetical protein
MQKYHILDKEFKALLSKMPPVNLKTGPWIAGGVARKLLCKKRWQGGDIDVFFKDEEQRIAWSAEFKKIFNVDQPSSIAYQTFDISDISQMIVQETVDYSHTISDSDNAVTWAIVNKNSSVYHVQAIKTRYATSLEELWDGFDITVCQFAVDASGIVRTDRAIQDLYDNKLTIHGKKKIAASRILKYHSYGFHVDDSMLLDVAKQINDNTINLTSDY